MTARAGSSDIPRWLVLLIAVVVVADLALTGVHLARTAGEATAGEATAGESTAGESTAAPTPASTLAPTPAATPTSPGRARISPDADPAVDPDADPDAGSDAGSEAQAAAGATRAAQVRDLLERRARALLERDRAAFLATVDPAQPEFVAAQAALFDNIARVPLASWSYQLYADYEQPTTDPAVAARLTSYHTETWAPGVTLSFALAGFDPEPTVVDVYFSFVERDGRWLLGGDDDFAPAGLHTARGLWHFGPVVAVTGRSGLVLGHPSQLPALRRLSRAVEAAVPLVTDVWGTNWTGRVVVLVPGSAEELHRLVVAGSDLSQFAAVATAELIGGSDTYHPVGDRILINPANFVDLGPIGRRVVLAHEITHVATRAVSGPQMPSWLVEGFADYVGYRSVGVTVASAARELAVEVRRGRLPAALPTDEDFSGGNPRLAQTYEAAWLACRLIAERAGEDALLSFYRAVGTAHTSAPAAAVGQGSGPVEKAFRAVLGTTRATFTETWRDYLRTQLT